MTKQNFRPTLKRLLCTGLALAALSACQTTDSGYYETDSGYYSSARQAAAAQAAAAKSEDLAILDYYRERFRLALGKREQVRAAKVAGVVKEDDVSTPSEFSRYVRQHRPSHADTAPPAAHPSHHGWRPMRY